MEYSVNSIRLLHTTGDEQVDSVLSSTVAAFEDAFPARIRSYYIEGSYADSSGVVTSDVDLQVIFKGSVAHEAERKKADDLAGQCSTLSTIELDIEMKDEQSLAGGIAPNLKMGSLLIYGEDICESLPLIPLAEWTRDRMHSSFWRTARLFRRSDSVAYPLDYPDPTGEFYGYDLRKLCLKDGREVNCTRDLIRLTGWSATALIAFKAGRYVARKSDCHKIYRECFDDEWGALLQDIYELCRGRWSYLIPKDGDERLKLRAICERTLAFENHFLLIYKEFLLSELHAADIQAKQRALWLLQQIVYQDAEIQAAVHALERHKDHTVREAAQKAIQQ
jgi:hypothetical protein